MDKEQQVIEIFKDLCNAPTGSVKEDFTIGTLKESHTGLFIRILAGHLVSLNYHKQLIGKWLFKKYVGVGYYFCSNCGTEYQLPSTWSKYDVREYCKYCSNCGARMENEEA
jgi:transcription elongation factor Elf1